MNNTKLYIIGCCVILIWVLNLLSNQLSTVNAQQPEFELMSSTNIADTGQAIELIINKNEYLYIAATTVLKIVDISDAKQPLVVGSYVISTGIRTMTMVDNYLYLTDYSLSLQIIDVSNVNAPTLANTYQSQNYQYPTHLQYSPTDNLVYFSWQYCPSVNCGAGLTILDVSNPLYPEEVGNYLNIPSPVINLLVNPPYLYLTYANDECSNPVFPICLETDFQIVDISNPTTPQEITTLLIPYRVHNLAINNQHFYFIGFPRILQYGDSYTTLIVVDISTANNPIIISTKSIGIDDISSIGVKDKYVFTVGIVFSGLKATNVANPYKPTYTVAHPQKGNALVLDDTYLYTGFGTTLYIFHPRLPNLSLMGQVQDVNGVAVGGVNIAISNNLSTTTAISNDNNITQGVYKFENLALNTYTITPTLAGYSFQPLTRSIHLWPDSPPQNFTMLAEAITSSITISNINNSNSLSYTDTQGLNTHLNFPAGAINQPSTLYLKPTTNHFLQGWAFASHAFYLMAYQQYTSTMASTLSLQMPIELNIHYSNQDISAVSDETALSLKWWHNNQWQDATETCNPPSSYTHDLNNKIISLQICQFGQFALFGPSIIQHQFMPFALKHYNPYHLVADVAHNTQPALSPDNKWIIFISDADEQADIFRAPLKGNHPSFNLSQTFAADEGTPIFSPNGSSIIFASNRSGDWDIYQMDLYGTNIQQLVGYPDSDEVHPTLSSDGLSLSFSSNYFDDNWEIYLADLQTTAWTRLTYNNDVDRFPSFSPDGRQLLFRSERDGNSEIYLLDIDSLNTYRLTNNVAFDGYASFMPFSTGSLIPPSTASLLSFSNGFMFVSNRSGNWQSYVADLSGNNVYQLSTNITPIIDTPRFTADGKRIIYAANTANGNYDIYFYHKPVNQLDLENTLKPWLIKQ